LGSKYHDALLVLALTGIWATELMKGSKESLKAQGLLSLTIQGVNVTAISGQPARHL
jgi:hypothetical protein